MTPKTETYREKYAASCVISFRAWGTDIRDEPPSPFFPPQNAFLSLCVCVLPSPTPTFTVMCFFFLLLRDAHRHCPLSYSTICVRDDIARAPRPHFERRLPLYILPSRLCARVQERYARKSEAEDLKRVFHRLDSKADGKIDLEELQAIFTQYKHKVSKVRRHSVMMISTP